MSNAFNFLIHRSALENVPVDDVITDDAIWLNQQAMATLFDCTSDNISLHQKIYMQRVNPASRQLPRISR